MVNFEENKSFRSDLLIEFLDKLRINDEREEFTKFFGEFEQQFNEIKERIDSSEKLRKIQNIIEYKNTKKVQFN